MKTAVKNREKILLCSTLLEQHKSELKKKNFFACHPPFKNARMSCLGMQFYTTTELARCCQGSVSGETEISRVSYHA